ncbi:iron(III) transport system permease protein [Rhizobium sp. BK313]|uniref:ABC transporter permease n=1 Tax=Rhizobium sp. BK313 TaxID=2587081 RepID=UPI0010D5E7B4|nr:ABC transporter permease subunit [Rhizobium sp. BK313]MBB3451989.1 iron(III) transport system permease protein [Rhizobium sp. BK313]
MTVLNHEGAAAFVRGSSSGRLSPNQLLPLLGRLCGPIAIYAVFLLLIGLPLALVLVQAVMPRLFDIQAGSTAFSLEPLAHAFASPRILQSILNSLELAATVAVTTTALGGAFAVLVQRCNVPLRGVIAVTPWLVFLTPSYLKALAWVLLMSSGGYLAQLGILPQSWSEAFFGLEGLVFVHTLGLFPLASFIIASALAGLGSELEDAARLSGSSPLKIWLRINGPLLAPAIALSVIATFAEVLSDFGLASTIARTSNFGVLTYGIYSATSDYPVDFASAGAQALILLALVLLVVAADRMLRRRADPRLISGRARPARRYELGFWRWPATIAALAVVFLSLILPLLAVAIRALSQTLGHGLDWSNFTLINVQTALSLGTAANEGLLRSLGYAGLTAIIASSIALLLSARLDRSNSLMRTIAIGLSLGAVAIPGIVLGFGYILVWNRLPGFRDWPFPHYGDGSLLVTGYVAAALPYCLVVILSAIGQIAPSLTDAARLQGAGAIRRLLAITLPLVFLSVVTAFLLTFIRTVFELPMSQMLIPLSGPAAPTLILKLFSHDQDGLACAIALLAMAVAGGGAAIAWMLVRRFMPDRSRNTRGENAQ